MRFSDDHKLSPEDREELRKFREYVKRRSELPAEQDFVAYGEVYGEVVFEDKEAARALS